MTQPDDMLQTNAELEGEGGGVQEQPDEVKRLEKAYELAKELFNFSESVTKTIDEKSRNSVTTASAIAAFAFLVRKPENFGALTPETGWVLPVMAFTIGAVYLLHFVIVRPQKTKTLNPQQLSQLLQEATWPEEVIAFNFRTLSGMYAANLKLNQQRARWLSGQNFALLLTLAAALTYLALGHQNQIGLGRQGAPALVSPRAVGGEIPRPSIEEPSQPSAPKGSAP